MAFNIKSPFGFGRAQSDDIVHKFGQSLDVGTSYAPVSIGEIYRTPQVAGATALRVKAGGDAGDTAAGAGARGVTLIGLDETGAYAEETIATAGISASSNTTTTFLRLFRAFVSASGTYATASAGSHVADIVIENSAGTEDWATIKLSNFPLGQSEIGFYTVPLGKRALVQQIVLEVDATKAVDFIFLQRPNILETSDPYSAMRVVQGFSGVEGVFNLQLANPYIFSALTDIGFMAKGSSPAEVSCDFEMQILDA